MLDQIRFQTFSCGKTTPHRPMWPLTELCGSTFQMPPMKTDHPKKPPDMCSSVRTRIGWPWPSIGRCSVALKADGSMWQWSFPQTFPTYAFKNYSINTPPTRLGIHDDWVGLIGVLEWSGFAGRRWQPVVLAGDAASRTRFKTSQAAKTARQCFHSGGLNDLEKPRNRGK